MREPPPTARSTPRWPVAAAGCATGCADAVTARAAAGASSVVLAPVGGRPLEQLEHFAEAVLPRLREG